MASTSRERFFALEYQSFFSARRLELRDMRAEVTPKKMGTFEIEVTYVTPRAG